MLAYFFLMVLIEVFVYLGNLFQELQNGCSFFFTFRKIHTIHLEQTVVEHIFDDAFQSEQSVKVDVHWTQTFLLKQMKPRGHFSPVLDNFIYKFLTIFAL